MTEEKKKQIVLVAQQFKDEYAKLNELEFILQDLRMFCAINSKELVGGNNNIDPGKAMIMAGRATVFERIDYYINTPIEQIVNDITNKLGA